MYQSNNNLMIIELIFLGILLELLIIIAAMGFSRTARIYKEHLYFQHIDTRLDLIKKSLQTNNQDSV